jgi:hypothetical protein
MFELGNQRVVHRSQTDKYGRHYTVWLPEFETAKAFFLFCGASRHVSMDLNGQDGALPRDICDPVTDLGVFDVVTNFGCSEHIHDQRGCFQGLHALCRVGGVMVHVVPPVGEWPGHGQYHYTEQFFEGLARANAYRVVLLRRAAGEPHRPLLCCGLVKQEDALFACPRSLQAGTWMEDGTTTG